MGFQLERVQGRLQDCKDNASAVIETLRESQFDERYLQLDAAHEYPSLCGMYQATISIAEDKVRGLMVNMMRLEKLIKELQEDAAK